MARTLLELTVFETFVYIIAGWVVISNWQLFVKSFAYNGLKLDRDHPYHNFYSRDCNFWYILNYFISSGTNNGKRWK